MISVLTGGGGGAKFIQGLVACFKDPESVAAIVNTGDDLDLHGLRISPDIDSVTYYLADKINFKTGWGIADETFFAMGALEALGGESWFSLGDKDLGTHLYRTQRLLQGATLSQVTNEIAHRLGITAKILPMTDNAVSTMLKVDLDSFEHIGLTGSEIGFQHYFVKYRCMPKVLSIRFLNADTAQASEAVLRSIEESELIILGPSNPFLSLDPILSIAAIKDLIQENKHKVLAISPIVGGKALKGPLSKLLLELGKKSDVLSVAEYLKDLASYLVIDEADVSHSDLIASMGYDLLVTNTVMKNKDDAMQLAQFILDRVFK